MTEPDFASNLAKEEPAEATAQEGFDHMTQDDKLTKVASTQDIKYKNNESASLIRSSQI